MSKLFFGLLTFFILLGCKQKPMFKILDEENIVLDEWTKFSFKDEFGDPYMFGFDFKTNELNSDYIINLDLTSIGVLTTVKNINGKEIPLNSLSEFLTISEYIIFKIKKEDNSIIELKSSRINQPYTIVNLAESEFYKLLTNGKGELLKISLQNDNAMNIASFKTITIDAEFKVEK